MTKLVNVTVSKGFPRVFLATPSYDGRAGQAYTASLVASIPALIGAGFGVTYCLLGENCHVDDARNALVREFIKTDCTDLVFLDADIGWRPEDLLSLLRHPVPIVGGAYPKKGNGEEYPVHVAPGTSLQADENGLVQVDGLPTGFLRIQRAAMERMLHAHGHRQFLGQDKSDTIPYSILFERTYKDGHRWSGDYAFCRKWAEIGGALYVDPRFEFIHEGTAQWSGSLGEHWREKHGINALMRQERFDAAVEDLRHGRETIETWTYLYQGWNNPYAAKPELLAVIANLARSADGPILECGSGLSSLVLGLCSRFQVWTLEDDPIYASYTSRMLNKYNISNVEVYNCPLRFYENSKWYDIDLHEDINIVNPYINFSLAIVDGPPRNLVYSRIGIKCLKRSLINANILIDDADENTIQEFSNEFERELKLIGEHKNIAVGVRVV